MTPEDPPPNHCPRPQRLADFLRGRLPEPELEAVVSHLSTCPECEGVLRGLDSDDQADSLAGKIGRCLRTPAEEDPACRAMEEAAIAFVGRPDGGDSTRSLVPAGLAPEVGPLVGPYAVVGAVGQGGMGVVFQARHSRTNREAAVKVLRNSGRAGRDLLARFRVEAEAVARLDHPNVVRLYEFGEADGLPYLAMEWADGGTLTAALANGPLPARRAAEVVRDLARAVECAHRKGVLHRDLKPANVLLTRDGTPKLADFGLAKLIDGDDDLTQTNAAIGTPSYMAPELVGSAKQAGPAVDIYGLGAVLYEALTGLPPYKGETRYDTVRLVCEAKPVPPSRHRPGVPAGLEAVCLRCLRKPPGQRYPTAGALADALDAWLNSGRWSAVTAVAGRALRSAGRRWRGIAACFALAAVAAAVPLWDADRPLRAAQAELRAGKPATLVGEKGKPAWFRFRAGASTTKTDTASDGAFRVHAAEVALLELMSDPQTDRYVVTAKIRHEKSNRPGGVGLYCGRQVIRSDDGEIDAFHFVTFDDVRGPPNVVLPRIKLKPTNAAALHTRLYREADTPLRVNGMTGGPVGPDFFPAGESLTGWRDVSVVVSLAGVTANWEGNDFGLTADRIGENLTTSLNDIRTRHGTDTLLAAAAPGLAPRGGLGLYLERGSASFRDVTVTPLPGE